VGAIVFGIFKLLSHFKVSGKYIGLLPIVENMIGKDATHPGDIQVCYNIQN
jgi:leucyl aminopeptidase